MSKMIDSEKVIKAIKDGIANDWSMSAREAIEIIRKHEQPVSGDDNPRLEASFIADSISDYGKKQPVSGGGDAISKSAAILEIEKLFLPKTCVDNHNRNCALEDARRMVRNTPLITQPIKADGIIEALQAANIISIKSEG